MKIKLPKKGAIREKIVERISVKCGKTYKRSVTEANQNRRQYHKGSVKTLLTQPVAPVGSMKRILCSNWLSERA